GGEYVQLHSEKDLHVVVEGLETRQVGESRTTNIGTYEEHTTGGYQLNTIKSYRDTTIQGLDKLTVTEGDREEIFLKNYKNTTTQNIDMTSESGHVHITASDGYGVFDAKNHVRVISSGDKSV